MDSDTFLNTLQVPALAIVVTPASLYAKLQTLVDARQARGLRYSLPLVLTLLVLAKLAGEQSLSGVAQWVRLRADWLIATLGLKRKALPCANTYKNVTEKLDVAALNTLIGEFFGPAKSASPEPLEHWAADGKTLCGTVGHIDPNQTKVHLLSVYAVKTGAVLAQEQISTKTNEITGIQPLLDKLEVAGKVITLDALHTQRNLCSYLVKAQAYYVLIVKRNQRNLHADISLLFEGEWEADWEKRVATTLEKGHGRIETRHITVSSVLNEYLTPQWAEVQQVFKLERETIRKKKTSFETVYGLTNLPKSLAGPDELLAQVRGHWAIENRLHWRRDETLGEDASQVRTGQAPQVLASLNNLVLGLMDRLRVTNVPAKMREFAAKPALALQLLRGYDF